ncbi:MAG: choice-of-anchor J domain-containing protein, partial [Candidatus Cloacimonetes bacterium]|nr:choice-of-anchor J domain-containing protein [Candidatus Cloacimonadota bacterium]
AEGLTFPFTPPPAGEPPLAAQNPYPANEAINTPIGTSLSWSVGGGITDGYKVFLGTDLDATNIVNGTSQTENTFETNDFAYSTTYYWKIVPFNLHGDALDCPIWSFTTLADPTVTTYPYTQGFDNVTPPTLALGWTTINANQDAYTWESIGSGSQAGANAMRCRFNSSLAMNDWLVTPALHLTGGLVYKAKFYYRANSATTPEKLSVYLGTAPTTEAFTDLVFENLNINSITYALAEVIIPVTTTSNYYLGFQGHSNMNMNYLYLDSFSIIEFVDVINPPQNFAGSVVDDNDVVLTWIAPQVVARDFLGYKLYRDGTLLSTITNTATLIYTDMDLAVGNYSYTLVAVYDGGDSEPAGPVQVTIADMFPPANLAGTVEGYNNVHLTWDAPGAPPIVNNFTDGFETYDDFAINFAPWTLVDVDLSTTYGMTGITWLNAFAAQAYIIFNPSNATPAVTNTPTHSGNKMAASFASTTPPNNDWLISPSIPVVAGNVLKFWAHSYTVQYGMERFKVGISTTGTIPANFTIISGASYVETPADWTEYTYALDAYAGQSVKVGIQCVSHDAFIFFVDDVFVGAPAVAKSYPEVAYVPATATRALVNPNISRDPIVEPTRALLGYKVYRNATLLSTISDPDTFMYDDLAVAAGENAYSVTAYYSGGESVPAGPITITTLDPPAPPTNLSATVVSSSVTLNWTAPAGATLTGFKVYRDAVLISTITNPATVTYTQANVPNGQYVYGVLAVHNFGESAIVTADAMVNVQLAPAFFTDGFEGYDDFALAFAPWALFDRDLSATYGITGTEFPNSGAAMAYIIFNPANTVPAVTSLVPHGGAKVAACFAATSPPNNDWMVTPHLLLGTDSAIKFYAKSFDPAFLESFQVAVSTLAGLHIQSFTNIVSGPTPIVVPAEWTEYVFDLSAYDGQNIWVGIRCVSNDQFIFLVDDVSIHGNGGGVPNSDITVPVVATALLGNYPNPFNPETTIKYSVKENTPVRLEIYNVKGQLVKTLVNDIKATGTYSEVWKGLDNNNRPVSSGVYFFKMNAGKYSSTKKMIMMK